MLLENKVALIYGAGGPIGGAVARAFAREGARVFLAGRTKAKLDKVADEIRSIGGVADTAVVDALDERTVDEYVDALVEQAGRIDISFNLISYGDIQELLTEIAVEDFLQPITNAMRTHFLTTRAAARHMVKRGSGVILAFGGNGAQTLPGLGGFKVALDAIEGLRRQWACELGRHGIRVVTLKTGGVPESIPDTFAGKNEITTAIQKATLLNRAATLDDVGNVATFVASDHARTMTATEVNISCGALMD
ncbi:MAG: SDR family oxidoreductase [Chloroflexi bacterium]|nr:SDR family oxidoreductase [Chloroflexota bacterium]